MFSRPAVGFVSTAAPLTLLTVACGSVSTPSESQVDVQKAIADRVATEAWSRPGPLGIPVEGWAWIGGIGLIMLIILLGLVAFWTYDACADKRHKAAALDKSRVAASEKTALALASRPQCPACGNDPASFAAVQAVIQAEAVKVVNG